MRLVLLGCLLSLCACDPEIAEDAPDVGDLARGVVAHDTCSGTAPLTPGVTHPRGLFRRFELVHEGVTRTFKVRVPAGYTGRDPVPVVFAGHALTQDGVQFGVFGSDLEAKADQAGFLAVFPDGRYRSWNGGGCCDRAAEENVDDVGFYRAMLAQVQDTLGLCVDRTRVYATGLSNGAYLSYRLACDASDVFAAIAPVAGALAMPVDACRATQRRPVPLLALHGTADRIVEYPRAVASVDAWAALAGCSATTVTAAQPPSRLDTRCVTHTGCPGGVEVTLCSVDLGGHCWFGNATCGTGVPGGGIFVGRNARGIAAASAIWDFFQRFRCETCGLP